MPDTFVPLSDHGERFTTFVRTVPVTPATDGAADIRRFEVDIDRTRVPSPSFDVSGRASIPDALLRAAREHAYAEGLAAGYADGLEEVRRATAQDRADAAAARDLAARDATAEVASVLRAVLVAAQRLEEQTAAVTAALAEQTLEAVASLTTAVLGHALARGEDTALDAVRRALDPLPDEGTVSLRLSPPDADIVRRATAAAPPDDVAAAWGGRAVTVLADPTLARGDAVANSGVAEVDARLEASLDRALGALRS